MNLFSLASIRGWGAAWLIAFSVSSVCAQSVQPGYLPYPDLINAIRIGKEAPPIFRAVMGRDTEKLRAELTQSPDLNVRTKDGLTPLITAFFTPEPLERVRMLLLAGADPNFPDKDGNTPLYYALRRGRANVAQLLLERGAKVKQLTSAGHSALRIVTEYWTRALIMPVLERGGDFNEEFRYGRLIHYAAARQDQELIDWLLQQGESIDRVSAIDGMTPLIAAVRWGNDTSARLVLERKAQVNAQDSAGWTALMHAVTHEKRVLADQLIRAQAADVKPAAKDGTTLYQIAGRRGFADLLEELEQSGVAREKIQLPSVLDRFVALPPVRRLALAMASFELYLYCEDMSTLEGEESDLERNRARQLLAGVYRLRSKAALEEKLKFYFETGERAAVAGEANELAKLSDAEFRTKVQPLLEDPVKLNELRKARKLAQAVGYDGFLAWDLCHHNALAILGVRAGWLEADAAWKQISDAAETFKASSASWSTVADVMRRQLAVTFIDPPRAEAMLRLFSNKMDANSPWVLAPLGPKTVDPH